MKCHTLMNCIYRLVGSYVHKVWVSDAGIAWRRSTGLGLFVDTGLQGIGFDWQYIGRFLSHNEAVALHRAGWHGQGHSDEKICRG